VGLSLDGFPDQAPRLIRRTVGAVLHRLLFGRGRIPEGVRAPPTYVPRAGLDAAREGDALRAALVRFQASAGPFAEHPLLGRLSPAQWEQFHRLHCAHHLSFALPRAERGYL
jgi:hypothetical protein